MKPLSGRRRLLMLALLAVLLPAAAAGAWRGVLTRRAEAHRRAAAADLARHRYESAYRHALAAAEFWPQRGDVRFLAARSARRATHPDEARPHLAAARRLLGDTPDVLLEQQLIVVQKGEASEFAEHELRQRADIDRANRTLILEALAGGLLSTFKVHLAKEVLDAWLADERDDPRPWYWRGLAKQQMGGALEEEALADFRAAVERDPDYDEARRRLALLLLKFKDAKEAAPHFEELLRRHPDGVADLVGLGRCRVALGDVDAGRDLLDRALELAPDDVEALRERGLLALADDRADLAEPLLRRAYERLPQDPYVSDGLMRALFRLGREKEAKEHQARHDRLLKQQARLLQLMREELPKRPRDPELLYELGTMYLGTGTPQYEETGLWFLQKALEASPNHARTLQALIDHFMRKGRPEVAAQLRRRLR